MMKKKDTKSKTEFTQEIEVERFISQLEQYIKTSAHYADSGLKPESAPDECQNGYKACYNAIIKESSVLLLKSDKSLNHIVNFRFKLNGQAKGIPETDEKTYRYFGKIRRRQMSLIAAISDEVEIIISIIKGAEKMRKILHAHTGMLKKATYLMDVLGERIAKRPTPLLRMEDGDEKARELNETFRDMNQYEDAYQERFKAEFTNYSPENNLYQELIQESHQELERRKQNILSGIRDLSEGWDFLNRLLFKGYSRRMRRGLETMSDKHEQRASEFQEYVRKCRANYDFSEGNTAEKKQKKQKRNRKK